MMNTSPSRSLQPIKNAPRLPLGASPLKAAPKKGDGNIPELVRGLRRDVIELQHLIDEYEARPILSASIRQLEAVLLSLEHQPTDVQLVQLVKLVQERSHVVGSICCGQRSAETLTASYRSMAPVFGHLLHGCRELIALDNEIASANLSRDLLVKPPPSAAAVDGCPLTPQQTLGKQRIVSKSMLRSQERDVLQRGALEADSDTGGAEHIALDDGGPHDMTQGSTGGGLDMKLESSLTSHSPHGSVGNQRRASWSVDPRPSWLQQFQSELRSLGVDEATNSVEQVLREVLIAVQRKRYAVSPLQEKECTPSRRSTADEQLRNHITALTEELRLKDRIIQDLRTQLDGSRFSPNRHKTIASVHDEPMSFHVEKQYLKDHQRAQMRILELERDYQQLYDSGRADRERSVSLTVEVERLTASVKKLESDAASLRRARDEQEELFLGVSRTRKEEARMGAVAVTQLEGRVAELTSQLDRVQTKHGILQGNFESLFDDWCDTQQRVEEGKVLREYQSGEIKKYKEVYHQAIVERLEHTQKQLMEACNTADENEAQKTIIKQQYDDSQQVVQSLHEESKNLIDRVRASTEWKLLTVKAPEETKQLLARWQAMQAERERRENSALKTQAERVTTYKQRAATEITSRRAQRMEEMDVVDAASILYAYEMSIAPEPVLQKFSFANQEDNDVDNEMSSSGTRISRDVRQAFVQESSQRLVTFEHFWSELFPGEDL